MGKAYLIIFVVILALLISDGDCWGRRRRRRRREPSGGRSGPTNARYKNPVKIDQSLASKETLEKGGQRKPSSTFTYESLMNRGSSEGWSPSNGGLTYKFKHGQSITAYGSFKNGGTIGFKYTIPIGRKRRSIEDEKLGTIVRDDTGMPEFLNPKPLFFKNEKQAAIDKEEVSDDLSTPENGMNQDTDDCSQCLEIQPFNASDQNVENKTLASNDFVMVVKLMEENLSALKLDTKIKFEVIDVVKSPTDSITSGQTFTIKAQMATCPCIATLDPGFYIVTGQADDENQLVLSNVLMEFEN